MSSNSMAGEAEYEKVIENIDTTEILEGTRWEGSFDEDEPFPKEFLGLVGAVGGYALGEILGRGAGGMIDRKLAAMDERMSEGDEDDDTDEADSEDDTHEQSESSTDSTSDHDADHDQDENSSSEDEGTNESTEEDFPAIGGDSV